jgi:hypothetical protein
MATRKPSNPPRSAPIVWPRADPTALAAFDPATKRCTMNCGQSTMDPRSAKECKLLCDDCEPIDLMQLRCRTCGMTFEKRLGYVDACPMKFPEQDCPGFDQSKEASSTS